MERRKSSPTMRPRTQRGLMGGSRSGSVDSVGAPALSAEEAELLKSPTPHGFSRRESSRASYRRYPSPPTKHASGMRPRRKASSSAIPVQEEGSDPLSRRGSTDEPNPVGTGDAPISDAGTTAWDPEALAISYQDVREELELSGHNLTSVLNNPRETFMDSLYEAAFETAFEAEPPLEMAGVPHGLREVTLQVRTDFVQHAMRSRAIASCQNMEVEPRQTFRNQPVRAPDTSRLSRGNLIRILFCVAGLADCTQASCLGCRRTMPRKACRDQKTLRICVGGFTGSFSWRSLA